MTTPPPDFDHPTPEPEIVDPDARHSTTSRIWDSIVSMTLLLIGGVFITTLSASRVIGHMLIARNLRGGERLHVTTQLSEWPDDFVITSSAGASDEQVRTNKLVIGVVLLVVSAAARGKLIDVRLAGTAFDTPDPAPKQDDDGVTS